MSPIVVLDAGVRRRPESLLERRLAHLIRDQGLPEPAREFCFAPPRLWRFDFAWLDRALAVEVEGGTFARGRHTRGGGFDTDCEKYATAMLRGWRVLRVTGTHLRNGQAVAWIWAAMDQPAGTIPVALPLEHRPRRG